MLLAALRRFLLLTVGIAAGTAVVSLMLGLALGSTAARSISLGFYLIGSFCMVAGIFIGSRGPTRVKKSETPGSSVVLFPFFGNVTNRRLRWATLSEQHETINNSAIFVGLGFVIVVFGVLIAGRF